MREMLRIKRSVQAMYNTQVNMMSAQMLNNASSQVSDVPVDAMRLLDSKVASNKGNKD
jgi:pre-mRNA-splicing factor SYF1